MIPSSRKLSLKNMLSQRTWFRLLLGIATGLAVVGVVFAVRLINTPTSPEQVAEAFFRAGYEHDYGSAWELVSSQDQAARSKPAYLAANPHLSDQQAALYGQLAALGEFQLLAIASSRPDQTILTAKVRFPNSSQPEIEELIGLAADPASSRSELERQLEALNAGGQLGFFEGEVSFNLILDRNRWRVLQHWGTAITIELEAAVDPGLPWEFYPVQPQVLAQPGELVSANYVAINTSNETITGKAIHEVGPAEAAAYFQTIQCFCFTEQTLEPGEQREMQLVFRIDFSLPPGIELFRNRYTFYALEDFPAQD